MKDELKDLKKKNQELTFRIATLCDTLREQKEELRNNEELLNTLLQQRKDLGE